MDRFEIKPLPKRVEEELALGEEILREISNRRRGNLANMAFIDDSPFNLDMVFAYGRQLGKYPNPIRLIDVNSKRELHIPAEAFPEGVANADVEISLEKDVEFPKEQSSTVGFIRVNGVEYPIIGVYDAYNSLRGNSDHEALVQEWGDCEGSYRESTLDSFSQLRPGYKGGNTPNLFKRCDPCSKVNPKDVAKRRAKNKAARKNKRK